MSTTRKYTLRKLIQLLLLVFPTVLFQSCELEPNPTGNKVEAQILNFEGLPMYPGNLSSFNVSTGFYPVLKPDYLGYCRFENVLTPYNIYAVRGEKIHFYKEISIRNPKIVIVDHDGPNTNKCILPVKFPTIPEGEYGYVRFISRDMLIQDYGNYFLIDENHSETSIRIEVPAGRESISGKLIYMQCYATEYPAFEIWQYLNFGIKDVSIHKGTNDTVEFSNSEIQLNPVESTVNVNIHFPEPYAANLSFYLSFPGFSNGSDIMVGYYHNFGENRSQTVPSTLTIPFSIKVESSYWNYTVPNPYDFRPRKTISMLPGQTAEIFHEKLNLLSPQNNEEGISSSSVLKAEDTGDKGIFVFSIGLKSDTLEPSVYIYTDKSELKLNEGPGYLTLIPNTWYAWSAGKYSTFNSIDEFLTVPYVIRENFNTFRFSGKRYFKTAP